MSLSLIGSKSRRNFGIRQLRRGCSSGGAEKGSAQEAQGSKLPERLPTSRPDTTRQVHFSSDKEHDRLRKECWSLRGTAFQFGASPRNRRTSIHKMDPVDSTKRLEVEVKRLGSPRVQGEQEGASAAGPHNLVSGVGAAKGQGGLLWYVGVCVGRFTVSEAKWNLAVFCYVSLD